jgi:hypothetical protein
MATFHSTKKKSLVCCVVDNRHLYSSGWATEVSNNISDFLIHRFISRGYDVMIDEDENTLLNDATTSGYEHALIIAGGTSLGLSDRLFSALENLCQKDFFLAGHILHRSKESYYGDAYYELHHQFYVVNLKEFKELNCPIIGKPDEAMHVQIAPLRSEGCLYNDHEIPEWINPGINEHTYTQKLHGWNIISIGLANDKILIDLGTDIRNNKKYLYYEHDHVFLREISSIYWNHFLSNNFYASWNSDQLKEDFISDKAIDQYITVGIGVYWIHNLTNLGITTNTKVVFTDINYNCLKFMETMINEWDGKDYHEFYRKHMPRLPNNSSINIESYIEYTKKEWEAFLLLFDNWDETWRKMRSLKFDYQLIDYMSDYNLNWITPGVNTLINLSDVFTHAPPIATQSLKYRISCENRLINNICKVDPNIKLLMTSRAADGFHPNHQVKFDHVENFDLTNINILKKPKWHQSDWVHSGARPIGV